MAVDINRSTSGVVLPKPISSEIWSKTLENSIFMSLARKIDIPGTGTTIQTITGEPIANWVNETDTKPISTHKFGKKVMTPYKIALIEPFSNEFLRDKETLYAECARRLPYALAKTFDSTILGTTPPGTGFDVLGDAAKINIADTSSTVYKQFLAADTAISAADGVMNGIGLSPAGKSVVLGAVDTTGRPIFNQDVHGNSIGNILGANVTVSKAAAVPESNVIGIAGDFDDATYGVVEGIKTSTSDQATLKNGTEEINLFQQNMFALRVEMEVAFLVKDKSEFVLLTNAA